MLLQLALQKKRILRSKKAERASLVFMLTLFLLLSMIMTPTAALAATDGGDGGAVAAAAEEGISLTITDNTTGGLKTAVDAALAKYPDAGYGDVISLTITGDTDNTDFRFIKDNMDKLEILDAKDSTLVVFPLEFTTAFGGMGEAWGLPPHENLKSVKLPGNNESPYTLPGGLGAAFYNCFALEYADISCAKDIPDNCFAYCRSLKEVELPAKVDSYSIGSGAFRASAQATEGMTSFDFSKVSSIGANAFNGSFITSADLSGVTSIGDSAFASSKNLASVTMPAGVCNIGSSPFNGTALTSVDLSGMAANASGVVALAANLFNGCANLTTVTMPDGPYTLGASAFAGTGLTSLDLSGIAATSGVAAIPATLFNGCANLTSVTMPDGPYTLGASAFAGTGLESLDLSGIVVNASGVADLPATLFSGCSNLTSVTMPTVPYTLGASALAGTGLTSFDLSDIAVNASGVAAIPATLFSGCSNLTSVTMPTVPYTLGASVFAGTGLESFDLSGIAATSGVAAIPATLFNGCSNLTSVTMPADPYTLGASVFAGTGLESFDLSGMATTSGVAQLPAGLFNGCSDLASVTMPPSFAFTGTASASGQSFFEGTAAALIDLRGMTTNPSNLVALGQYMFRNCTELEEVLLPDLSITIGNETFKNCPNLKKIDLSKVTTLGNSVFDGAAALKAADLSSAASIGNNTFINSGIKAVLLPDTPPATYVGTTQWATDGSFAGLLQDESALFLVSDKTAYEALAADPATEGGALTSGNLIKRNIYPRLTVPSVTGPDTIYEGDTFSLAAVPGNAGEGNYQWYKDSAEISGAVSASYSKTAEAGDFGLYSFSVYGLALPAVFALGGTPPQSQEVFQFEVTIPADGGTFAIPLNGNLNSGAGSPYVSSASIVWGKSYDWDIEWGDGSNEHRSSSDPGAPQNASDSPGIPHSYAAGGIYTITIKPAGSEEAWLGAFGFSNDSSPANAEANRLMLTKVISPLTPLMTRTQAQITGAATPPDNEWAYTFFKCINLTMGEDFTFSGGWDTITSVGDNFATWMFYGEFPVLVPAEGVVWGEYRRHALDMNEVFNLPQGLTTVGGYFAHEMFKFVGAIPTYYDRSEGTDYYSFYTPFTMNKVFNLPQGITTVGEHFASGMFSYCNGTSFNMNEVFNLPQALTSVGDSFAFSMFNNCDGFSFNMNEVFNLPQGITTVGDAFAGQMFADCYGDAFTMNEVFNLPQGITSVGDRFALTMFGCNVYAALIDNPSFAMNEIFNLPQGITSVGNDFASYMFQNRNDDTFTMNEVFNLPQSITTAGNNFARDMFTLCGGPYFNMNEVFNLPQGITIAGDNFAREMFYGGDNNYYRYSSPVFTMNEVFNLPQDITSAGGNFADRMFADCFGDAFTMNEVFNLPQGITSAGANFANNMFSGCQGSGFMVNDVFKFPVLSAGDLNKNGVFYMAFYNLGTATAQQRSAASIIGGNATPANAIGTFFGSNCFLDRAYIPVNWGGSGQGSADNDLLLSQSSFVFPSAPAGYGPADNHTFVIYNFGTAAIENVNISISGGSFELGALSGASIQPGGSLAFTAKPVDGLVAGIHSGTVTVSADGCAAKTISLSFTVLAGAGSSEATVEEYNVTTDHSHHGSMSYDEDVQWVTLDVAFDRDVYYSGGLSIFDEITAYLGSGVLSGRAASPVQPDPAYDYTTIVFAKVLDDGRTLRIQAAKGANENGRLLVLANSPDKTLSSVTDAQGRPVILPDIDVTAPTGIRFDIVSQTAGTATSPAETVLQFVVPLEATRGMFHIMGVHNGDFFGSAGNDPDHPLANFGSGHNFDYLQMALGSAGLPQGAVVYPATAEHGGFVWNVTGRTVTITSSVNSPGEVWDLFVVNHPRDNAEAQAKLDKTALNAAITEANAAVQGDYSAEAWAVLQNELAIANVRAASIYYIQSELDGTAASLLAALADTEQVLEPSGAKVVSYKPVTGHQGEVNAITGLDDMYLTFDAEFDRDMTLTDATSVFDELTATLGGDNIAANRSGVPANAAAVLADGKTVRFTFHIGASTTGRLLIRAKDRDSFTLPSLTDADGRPVVLEDISMIISTILKDGNELSMIQQTVATENTPASVTKQFAYPQSATRGQVHTVLLKNGLQVPAGLYANAIGSEDFLPTATGHNFGYLDMTPNRLLSANDGIYGGLSASVSDDYVVSVSGDQITVTAKSSAPGDVLDLFIVGYPRDISVKIGGVNAPIPQDKETLAAAIAAAEAAGGANYSTTAYAALTAELAKAKAINVSPWYLQEEIDAQSAALLAALDGGVIVMNGDVNGDGVIDFEDVLDLMNHYTGIAILQGNALQAADVNGDGVIDFDDVLDLMNHYTGIAPLQ